MPAACPSRCRAARQRLIINCGVPARAASTGAPVARTTAAHSTVTLQRHLVLPLPRPRLVSANGWASRSSAARAESRSIATRSERAPPCSPVAQRLCRALRHRASAPAHAVARRRPPRRRGRLHADAGEALPASGKDEFAIRFHLQPSQGEPAREAHGVMLSCPTGVWEFDADGIASRSRRASSSPTRGTARTEQIVIHGRAQDASLQWTSAMHAPRPRSAPADESADEPRHGAECRRTVERGDPQPDQSSHDRASTAEPESAARHRLRSSRAGPADRPGRHAHDRPSPHHPRPALGLRQDRPGRPRPRARRPRRRAHLDRRHRKAPRATPASRCATWPTSPAFPR